MGVSFDGLWDGFYNGLWLGGSDDVVLPMGGYSGGYGYNEDEEIMGVIIAFMGVINGRT